MQRILDTTAGGIAAALELTVANIANPVELNAIGTAVPDWRLCHTNVAGSDEATLYRLDADTDLVNAPYVVASATAGLRWVAIAGRYQNQSFKTAGTLSGDTLTSARVAVVGGGGTIETSNNFLWDGQKVTLNAATGKSLQIASTTAATSAIVGAIVVGDQATPATNVAIGAGRIFAGTSITVGTGAASATNQVIIDGGASGADAGSAVIARNGGSSIIGIGNYSAMFGGAYDATPAIYAAARIRIEAPVRVNSSAAASSSITGAAVIGDGATAATNVGIGGGTIWAGSAVAINGTTGAGFRATSAFGYGILAFNADTSLSGTLGMFGGASGDDTLYLNCPLSSTISLRSNNAVMAQFTAATSRIASTNVASSSITGGLVVGDGATAATNVGLGGGAIYAGASIDSGLFLFCGTRTASAGSGGNVRYRDDTGTSRWLAGITGAAGATGFEWYDLIGGTTRMALSATGTLTCEGGTIMSRSTTTNGMFIADAWTGNVAVYRYRVNGANAFQTYADVGGNYVFNDLSNSTTPLQYVNGSIANGWWNFANTKAATSPISGTVVIGDGGTSATNVAIGGGNIFTGGSVTVRGGVYGAGRIYADATAGLVFAGVTGSAFDITVLNGGGLGVWYNPTGTRDMVQQGRLTTAASTTTQAGFNLPHGAAPSAPVDGDLWTTTAGLFVRINGVTVGPLT